MPKDVAIRVDAVTKKYGGDVRRFVAAYANENFAQWYNNPDTREALIVNSGESVAIMSMAFGRYNVVTVIMPYVMQLAISAGVTYDAQSVEIITGDILDGFHYLTIAQIICALKYARGGKLRDANGKNICTMYGQLQGNVIMDCVYHFVKCYRNPAIDKATQRALEIAKAKDLEDTITSEEYEKRKREREKESKGK